MSGSGRVEDVYASVHSLALKGIEALSIQIQVQIAPGLSSVTIVGLADKSVHESQSRIKSALTSMGLSLPPRRITVNLQPANLPKEGSHYDLPIALCLMAALGTLAQDDLESYVCMGELGLDGRLVSVPGVLPAAVLAGDQDRGLICPKANGAEACWIEGIEVLAVEHLLELVQHFKGDQALTRPSAPQVQEEINVPDLKEIQGQHSARRALEIAAVGGHSLLMIGPPGAGKSMLAARLPGILPPLEPMEALEVSMIQSVAGQLAHGAISRTRPYRDPHHSTSMPALIGGGNRATPGEVSLSHNGVLFLDELPEFSRQCLESLRQPLETATVTVARANIHITYPARFQLIAAMNPCRCGAAMDRDHYCARFPRCVEDYQSKISGPFLDRIDLYVPVLKMTMREMLKKRPSESSAEVRARVMQAHRFRLERQQTVSNARLTAHQLDHELEMDQEAREMLIEVAEAEHLDLSARGYHRSLRVARSLADLEGCRVIGKGHIAEALQYRYLRPGRR